MKIAIVGPESSGKSSLSKALSERLSISWVPEFARAYLDGLGRAYTEHDLIEIAKGQLALEDAFDEGEPQLLICDTNILVILIWAKDKFGRISPELKALWDPEPYALHLLLKPDLPWEPDPLRETPGQQDRMSLFCTSAGRNAPRRFRPARIILWMLLRNRYLFGIQNSHSFKSTSALFAELKSGSSLSACS